MKARANSDSSLDEVKKKKLSPPKSKLKKTNSKTAQDKKRKIPIEFDNCSDSQTVTPIIKRSKSRSNKGHNISFSLEDTTVRLIPTIVKENGFIVEDKVPEETYLDISSEDVPNFLQEDNLKSMYEAEKQKKKILKNNKSLHNKRKGTCELKSIQLSKLNNSKHTLKKSEDYFFGFFYGYSQFF